MWARLRILWSAIRDSLWFVPALITLVAGSLAVFLVEMERNGQISAGDVDHWLLGGGPEGARQMLSTIASGFITVTGVVFSVTTVALQLTSSQFTPRVLRNFTSDHSNQVVLGVFIGTFTYALLVLRVVQSPSSGDEPFVPRVAIIVAVVMVLVSVGFLIYFINHAARAMQVAFILEKVTRRSLHQAKRLFPETVGQASEFEVAPQDAPCEPGFAVHPDQGGYLQAVDGDTLFDLGRRMQLLIRMERRIGEFVRPDQRIASVWPPDAVDIATVRAIRSGFVLGLERTPEQDVEFGIIEIADIAVKALSPGINDPTTALHCIDRLGEILALLAVRNPLPDMRTRDGDVYFLAVHTDFERAVGLAFEQIRHFGSSNPVIVEKLLDTLKTLAEAAPEVRRPPLLSLAAELRAKKESLG